MPDIEGLSNEEIKQLIIANLRGFDIDPELISIKITKGSKIILRGAVETQRHRDLVVQTIQDVAGVEDVKDELVILQDEYGDFSDEEELEEEFLDDDNEYYGTDDIVKSIEDGLPYIPPMTSSFEEPTEEEEEPEKKKKRKRRKGE